MKIIGKLLSLLSAISYVLILGVLIVAGPIVLGFKPVVVLTGSMEPAYPVGSVIYYKQAAYEDIKVGDAITYQITDDAKSVVTHRVVQKEQGTQAFITKGDANATPDVNPIPYKNVRGKVIPYHLPVVGYFVQYIQNFFVIGSIGAILVAKILYDRVTDPDKDIQEAKSDQDLSQSKM